MGLVIGSSEGKGERQRMLYILSSGPGTPEKAYIPFILALIGVAMGLEASIYFIGEGVACLKKGMADNVQMGSFPTLKEMIDQALSSGVRLFACVRSCGLMGLTENDLIEGPSIIEADALNDMVRDSDGLIYF